MKAYRCQQRHGSGCAVIVYGKTRGQARRDGAIKLGIDFMDTEVKRLPWDDGYSSEVKRLPYKSKSKFSISFNKDVKQHLKKVRKDFKRINRRIMLSKTIIIFGYLNRTKAYEAKYRYEKNEKDEIKMDKEKALKFNHTAHKELWDWLVKNPDKEKIDWIGWAEYGGKYLRVAFRCFACEYAVNQNDIGSPRSCDYCPLKISKSKLDYDYNCLDGLFDAWENAEGIEERIKYAEMIRDFPVKEDIDCI